MKVTVCPKCADIHAKNIVDMYKGLKTPLVKIRDEKDQKKARDTLDRFLHDGITLGFYKGHGPINIDMDEDTMHILDKDDRRLCSDSSALKAVKSWKEGK